MTDHPDARPLELVSHAILAPSSHNNQCWLFRLGPERIEILPDRRRRCPVVDPDDHHLFVSLGCAAENLLQAAPASGLRGEARFRADAGGSVAVALDAGPVERSALFEAIATRQSTRCVYDGRRDRARPAAAGSPCTLRSRAIDAPLLSEAGESCGRDGVTRRAFDRRMPFGYIGVYARAASGRDRGRICRIPDG